MTCGRPFASSIGLCWPALTRDHPRRPLRSRAFGHNRAMMRTANRPLSSSTRLFELPCSERVRTMMRFECLAHRLEALMEETSEHAHLEWLRVQFELYDLLSTRSDIKHELLQELERQRQQLARFQGEPGVALEKLEEVLSQVNHLHERLADAPTRMGPHLAEIDFLTALKGRSSIPAGACPFDMPVLYAWLLRAPEQRQANMHEWLDHLRPILSAARLSLRLIREVADPTSQIAEEGRFEMNPNGRQARLIRVWVERDRELICDMSANKFTVAVRFRTINQLLQPETLSEPVPFQIALCEF
ncbi:MAG: cell division protein ZapD [Betaproteobacteria bacterium]|nr:cell division protein ZapD [Betaproteobacteria bacterium]